MGFCDEHQGIFGNGIGQYFFKGHYFPDIFKTDVYDGPESGLLDKKICDLDCG